MKFNKLILNSFILLVLLFSVTAISAADLNDTSNIDVLKDNEINNNSFSEFNQKIYVEESNSMDLDCDYKYDEKYDWDYATGNQITKTNFVINGNGHTIDCNNQARAFNITGNNTKINNLIIKNGFYELGSAISTKVSITLNNVTFINCSGNGTNNLGAVFTNGPLLTISNCKFINTSGTEGASVTAYYSAVNITNSTFMSSSDKINKGHIYVYESELLVSSSDFLNTTAKYATAIFAEDKCAILLEDTKFRNLFANMTAGAIGVKLIDELIISNCEFNNVSSVNNGGALFADINGEQKHKTNSVIINGSDFKNCKSGFGGAILQLAGSLMINGSNFIFNQADYEGGAIYTSFADVEIIDSIFRNNSVTDEISYGGACYFDMGVVGLEGDLFENNTGSIVSTIYAYDTNLEIERSYFENPSNVTSLYIVYGDIEHDKRTNFTTDNISTGNTNYNYNFENPSNPIIIINDTPEIDELPAHFDLREKGWVSEVKNQGFMGACWAFGNLAALESAFMKYANVTYSFSVNNMQNSMLQYSKYGRITAVEGGRPFSGIAYLIDWLGIYPDEYDGYDELGKISSLYLTPDDIHIQNVVVIPARKTTGDNDLIKMALMKYGAVATSHHADFDKSKYFNGVAQYYTGDKPADHTVCIVGWDDNYPKDNFKTHAPGDGAWIVKNSWGTDWGDGGFFYVSYYDTSFAADDNIAFILTNDTYNRIYQNDVGGLGEWSDDAKYYANAFTAEADELIAAVGTFFEKEGQKYEFTISVNDVDVYSQKGVSEFGGYATIKLNKFIQIKEGETFKVTFKNKMYYARLLRIHVQKNHSFASTDGKNWKDLASESIVPILKAYTIPDINMTQSLVKYYKNDTPFVAKVNAGENVTFQFKGINYTVKADENGFAKLNITSGPGKYSITTIYNGTSIVNYVIIKNTVISSNVERGYNSNYNYKLKVVDSAGNPLKNTYVKISLNNGKYKNYKSDKTGYVTIKFTKLTKKQTIKVKNPSTGEVKTTTIKVVSRFSSASNIVMYYFDGSKFKAKIIGNNAKAVGKGQIVTIKFNKKTYKVKTSAKGYISLKMPRTLKPGTYKLTATYKGQTIKKTIKVKQNLKTKKYTVKKSAKKLVVKATLKNGKKAVTGKKITLKLNGKKYTAKTNKYGIAKFTIKKNVIKKLKKGKKYTMKVSYLKNTIKTTLKVKR